MCKSYLEIFTVDQNGSLLKDGRTLKSTLEGFIYDQNGSVF